MLSDRLAIEWDPGLSHEYASCIESLSLLANDALGTHPPSKAIARALLALEWDAARPFAAREISKRIVDPGLKRDPLTLKTASLLSNLGFIAGATIAADMLDDDKRRETIPPALRFLGEVAVARGLTLHTPRGQRGFASALFMARTDHNNPPTIPLVTKREGMMELITLGVRDQRADLQEKAKDLARALDGQIALPDERRRGTGVYTRYRRHKKPHPRNSPITRLTV